MDHDAVSAHLASALSDRFRLERELGGGGMSRIFVATEHALQREVVIKVVPQEMLEGLSAARFAREVLFAARLQQANIVPVLASGSSDDMSWYSMPFVRGESLRARLERGERIAVAEGIGILRDIARALAFAHDEGVVHRDIKPENVLLSGGTAVVTDFGIAKAIHIARTAEMPTNPDLLARTGSTTQTGFAKGTPAYMSPEQAAGDEFVDERADLYSWGIVAWEMFSGRHPFADRKTQRALFVAHVAETPAPIQSIRPDVPAPLSALIAHCLEKDPKRRPRSAAAILEGLDALNTPLHSPAVRAHADAAASVNRQQTMVIVAVVALSAMAALAYWAMTAR
ncbi:MAG: serine/threonine-protein kinase [Gemmatimonadota bacterium]